MSKRDNVHIVKTGADYRAGMTPRYFSAQSDQENKGTYTTPEGSKLKHSPSKEILIYLTLATGEEIPVNFFLLERAEQYQSKQPLRLLGEICASNVRKSDVKRLSVTVDSETCSRNNRTQAVKEKKVVGCSAAEIVMNYCEKNNIVVTKNEVGALQFNLCHAAAFSIANNGVTEEDKRFNTQRAENILAGTRILNENMQRIETVILSLIREKSVTVKYTATYSKIVNSHIYSDIKLSASIFLPNGATIGFVCPFDVFENRKLPNEFSKALYAQLVDLIDRYGDTHNTRRALSFD